MTSGPQATPRPSPASGRTCWRRWRKARHFLRFTTRDLTDEQARQRTTVSELTLGGLIKHVTAVERNWARLHRARPVGGAGLHRHDRGRLRGTGPTASGCCPTRRSRARSPSTRRRPSTPTSSSPRCPTSTPSHPLPPAPWNPPGERWSARRTLLHIATETAQHAGHADIIRESLDGAKSMG